MDSEERSYEPIHVDMIGIEDGFDRFAKDGIATLPPVASWRNNLTALSQRYNLFFIASASRIAVYQPEFPFQTLKSQHALMITPDLANPHALGHISSHREGEDDHCINHLRVGSLGSQEILVLATDSGNVSAYHTSAILDAVQKGSAGSELLGLRPFFSEWVQQSAWGLDIHQDARMIAVSANRPDPNQLALSDDSMAPVTVFAFALTPRIDSDSEDSDSDRDQGEWRLWSSNDTLLRDYNYKIILAGQDAHHHNIPNISFVNSSSGSGCWIVSADITGFMKFWDIWKKRCVRTWFFGSVESVPRPRLNHQYPGWNVIALDTACFRLAHTNHEFFGAAKTPMYQGYMDRGNSYNVTGVVKRLPTNGQIHPSNVELVDGDESSDEDSIHGEVDLEESDHAAEESEAEQSPSPIDPRIRAPDFSQLSADYSGGRNHQIEYFNRSIIFDVETGTESEEESDEEEDESSRSDSPQSPPAAQQSSRLQRHIRQRVTPLPENIELPNVAMIHCSDSHVRLLSSPRAKFPHWFCADMLKQILPQNIDTSIQGFNFAHMDRLIVHHSIPDIGVLLIATQTGRVAVCALTCHPSGLLGMRVDCVLPTRRQERRGRRPEFCTLVGLAVSPVQARAKIFEHDTDSATSIANGHVDGIESTFDREVVVLDYSSQPKGQRKKMRRAAKKAGSSTSSDSLEGPAIEKREWSKTDLAGKEEWNTGIGDRRYRLMLTFSDLTVLTYEVSRTVGTRSVD